MVVCVHLPRFELTVAAGGAEALAGHALAIAPAPGAEARVGEVSGAAEACGVTRGMALGEALARCPRLRLVAGDPLGVAQEWGRAARALEGIGAALELPRAGLAYFESDGLRGLHGGEEGVVAAARQALRRPARVGAGPTRFCALAAALEVRSRRARIVAPSSAQRRFPARGAASTQRSHPAPDASALCGSAQGDHSTQPDHRAARRYLASRPVMLLGFRAETAALVEPLTRLGIDTLGELAALGRDAVADRFGAPGVLARRLARGEDDPLRTHIAEERLRESLELEEANSGPALERVLGVLVDRLLARPERRGRTLRALSISARLVEGGTWRERVVLREALSDPRRMRLALAPRLALLPAPAAYLRLETERFGPPEGAQGALFDPDPTSPARRAEHRGRLREAVAQVRAAAGPEAALRAVCVDPDSRVPERRVVFTPFPG
jgi:protein ImuB